MASFVLYCRYEEIVTDMISDEESSPDRRKAAARRNKYQQLSTGPRALYTVGQTQKMVQQEKSVGKKKIGVSCLKNRVNLSLYEKTILYW